MWPQAVDSAREGLQSLGAHAAYCYCLCMWPQAVYSASEGLQSHGEHVADCYCVCMWPHRLFFLPHVKACKSWRARWWHVTYRPEQAGAVCIMVAVQQTLSARILLFCLNMLSQSPTWRAQWRHGVSHGHEFKNLSGCCHESAEQMELSCLCMIRLLRPCRAP